MKEFRFVRAENGGWVVYEMREPGVLSPIKGAYTTFADLVDGLPFLLQPSEEPTPPAGGVEMGQGDV